MLMRPEIIRDVLYGEQGVVHGAKPGAVEVDMSTMSPAFQRERFAEVTDASFVEAAPLAILVITIVGIGVYPSFLTDVFQSGLEPIAAVLPGGG